MPNGCTVRHFIFWHGKRTAATVLIHLQVRAVSYHRKSKNSKFNKRYLICDHEHIHSLHIPFTYRGYRALAKSRNYRDSVKKSESSEIQELHTVYLWAPGIEPSQSPPTHSWTLYGYNTQFTNVISDWSHIEFDFGGTTKDPDTWG